MAETNTTAIPVTSLKAHTEEIRKIANLSLDQRIIGKFKFASGDLDTTLWAGKVRDSLRAMADLIIMADRAGVKPADLRRKRAYNVVVDNLRVLMQNVIMVKLGEDAQYAFALERGFEELLKRECKVIDDESAVKCKIRFVKPRELTHDGEYPVYERVTMRFDGQFEVSFIDGARYGS
jgi:hypothetical protein